MMGEAMREAVARGFPKWTLAWTGRARAGSFATWTRTRTTRSFLDPEHLSRRQHPIQARIPLSPYGGRLDRPHHLYTHRHHYWPPRIICSIPWSHNPAQEPCIESSPPRGAPEGRAPQAVSPLCLALISAAHRSIDYGFSALVCVPGLPLAAVTPSSFTAIFLSSNLFGSIFQIASLPVVILAPLGAVSLLWNAFFARILLGDVFSPWMLLGTLLIAGGAVLIAVFGIVPEPTRSLEDLLHLFNRPTFIAYFSLLGFAVFVWLAVVRNISPVSRVHP